MFLPTIFHATWQNQDYKNFMEWVLEAKSEIRPGFGTTPTKTSWHHLLPRNPGILHAYALLLSSDAKYSLKTELRGDQDIHTVLVDSAVSTGINY